MLNATVSNYTNLIVNLAVNKANNLALCFHYAMSDLGVQYKIQDT